jgi:hypothetical protein
MEAVVRGLDRLAELRSKRDKLREEPQGRIDAIMEEIAFLTADVDEEIEQLEGEIKEAALSHGSTVRGASLMAVWSKGRTTWDGEKLKGYAIAHPEIKVLQKVGKPSVSIQAVKESS